MWSQIGGTLPAPLFLFLAGISFALVTDKLLRKGMPIGQSCPHNHFARCGNFWPGAFVSPAGIRDLLGMGAVERSVASGRAEHHRPFHDADGSDVLGGAGSYAINQQRDSILGSSATVVASAISLLSPLLWTTWRMRWLPWPVESYINGVHNLGEPQAWLFPVFPWSAFAFAGLAVGFLLFSDWAKKLGATFFILAGASGVGMIYLSMWLDHGAIQIYPVYDYWHTSPNFFLLRVGLLLMILLVRMSGAAGELDSGDSVRSFNWGKLHCWSIGSTSNLSTDAFPSCITVPQNSWCVYRSAGDLPCDGCCCQ